jgi:hypothetical protein
MPSQETPLVHPVRITASVCLVAGLVNARTDTANLALTRLSLARYAQAARSSTAILARQDILTMPLLAAATRALYKLEQVLR